MTNPQSRTRTASRPLPSQVDPAVVNRLVTPEYDVVLVRLTKPVLDWLVALADAGLNFRPYNSRRGDEYAETMRKGRWDWSAECFAVVSEDGGLIQGQHRVRAALAANAYDGVPPIVEIRVGAPDRHSQVLDNGLTRNPSQHARALGWHTNDSAVFSRLWQLAKFGRLSGARVDTSVMYEVGPEAMQTIRAGVNLAERLLHPFPRRAKRGRIPGEPNLRAVVALMLHVGSEDDVSRLFFLAERVNKSAIHPPAPKGLDAAYAYLSNPKFLASTPADRKDAPTLLAPWIAFQDPKVTPTQLRRMLPFNLPDHAAEVAAINVAWTTYGPELSVTARALLGVAV